MAAAQLLLLFSILFASVGGPYRIKGLFVLLYSPFVHTQKQILFLLGLQVFSLVGFRAKRPRGRIPDVRFGDNIYAPTQRSGS